MSYFQANLAVLQERFPNTVNALKQFDRSEEETSTPVLEPLEKDQAWLDAVKGSVGDMNVIFVYGFGRGMGLADLIEMYPDRFFIVYEPDAGSFHAVMQQYELEELLKWPKILWLSAGESQLKILFNRICTYMNEELAFVALRHYLENGMEDLQQLKEDFIDYRNLFQSNRHTEKLFQKTWLENSVNQLAGMLSAPSLFEVAGSLKDYTAVIVASGPSLEQDIEWIKKFVPHALIISAGSSIQVLAKHGIRPHIATIMDGGDINEKIFSVEGTLDSPLFYVSSAFHKISEKKQGDSFYAVVENDMISKYLLGMGQADQLISPTPTVTGTAIQVAAWLGASRIVLTGQDLSFQRDKFYSEGVEHGYQPHLDQVIQDSIHHVKNVYGEYNRTTNAFLMMKDALESIIASIPAIEFINATRGGAAIEGTEWQPAENVYEEIKGQNIPEHVVRQLIQTKNAQHSENEFFQEREALVKKRVIDILNDSSLVQQELTQVAKQLDKLPALSRTKAVKAWKSLEEIERKWATAVERPWFNPVFETTLSDRLDDFDRELPRIKVEAEIRKKSDLLYEHLGGLVAAIRAEIPWVQQILQEGLTRIERLNDKG